MSSTRTPWINLRNPSGNFSRDSKEENSWIYLGWELLTANPPWKHDGIFFVHPFLCYAWLLTFYFKCIKRLCCLLKIYFYYLQSSKNILQFIRGDLDNRPFFLCLPLLPMILFANIPCSAVSNEQPRFIFVLGAVQGICLISFITLLAVGICPIYFILRFFLFELRPVNFKNE